MDLQNNGTDFIKTYFVGSSLKRKFLISCVLPVIKFCSFMYLKLSKDYKINESNKVKLNSMEVIMKAKSDLQGRKFYFVESGCEPYPLNGHEEMIAYIDTVINDEWFIQNYGKFDYTINYIPNLSDANIGAAYAKVEGKNIFFIGGDFSKNTALHEIAHLVCYAKDNEIKNENSGHGAEYVKVNLDLCEHFLGRSDYLAKIAGLIFTGVDFKIDQKRFLNLYSRDDVRQGFKDYPVNKSFA